jgi:DNA-directed RNA polymerase subunit M/transcription elongation factor TFIIS
MDNKEDTHVDTLVTQNIPTRPTRHRVYTRFKDLLMKHWKDSETNLKVLAINIERAIFNYVLNSRKVKYWDKPFHNLYIDKAVSVYNNLDPCSVLYKQDKPLTTDWLEKITTRKITPHEFCFLHFTTVHPLVYKDIKLDTRSCMRKTVQVDDGFIQCISCKSYKTYYHEIQIRSSDESTDVMVTCSVCNYIWKLDN